MTKLRFFENFYFRPNLNEKLIFRFNWSKMEKYDQLFIFFEEKKSHLAARKLADPIFFFFGFSSTRTEWLILKWLITILTTKNSKINHRFFLKIKKIFLFYFFKAEPKKKRAVSIYKNN